MFQATQLRISHICELSKVQSCTDCPRSLIYQPVSQSAQQSGEYVLDEFATRIWDLKLHIIIGSRGASSDSRLGFCYVL